jgi:GTPase SAR1 family protein
MLKPCTSTGVPLARQQQILEALKSNPLGSFAFTGAPGVGKSTLARELVRLSHDAEYINHGFLVRTGAQYQEDATRVARGERVSGFIRPSDIALPIVRWTIFLDDVDKVTGTEFIRKELFNLIDASVQEKKLTTQVIITTNMSKPEFAKYFGDHIHWRLAKHCTWVAVERGAA